MSAASDSAALAAYAVKGQNGRLELLVVNKNPSTDVTEQIQVTAALLTDSFGRQLDGKHSGQPGGNFVANFSNKGIQAAAVYALFERGDVPSARR